MRRRSVELADVSSDSGCYMPRTRVINPRSLMSAAPVASKPAWAGVEKNVVSQVWGGEERIGRKAEDVLQRRYCDYKFETHSYPREKVSGSWERDVNCFCFLPKLKRTEAAVLSRPSKLTARGVSEGSHEEAVTSP